MDHIVIGTTIVKKYDIICAQSGDLDLAGLKYAVFGLG